NTMGVAVLGSYASVPPSENAQLRAEELLAWTCDRQSIDPAGQSLHPGTGIVIPNICGHRDANAATNPVACPSGTECPGNELFDLLPSIRMSVAELIDAGDPPSTGEKALKLRRSGHREAWPPDADEVRIAGVAGTDITAGGSRRAWVALVVLLVLLTIWFVTLVGKRRGSKAHDGLRKPKG
ncbi:MAG: N-acetylmuramoyl-L-alanine amidase, partial [Candidatus Hydrogenedentes bacterium]|nr:N-acetylmuramoyl-L-alanine amidase [Candidatus Hydrogenedentota bacterium]